ncbi:DUF4175 domain-containing protein [Flavobacterium sp. MXW15]|uniref:DUF4175 domain-containing protein n=1 Tax=Xanthomonas chitinilytica TaxID=2989819 RepID=A0ABT3JZ35_9XANT|nr:DUF4175 domain-containing protein [Xanthomonas sp. H13-6]MCW4456145.1 DUF4175 domain-containing protein [Flavobacterium sp. MXW15]MCW4473742.1 DUF4175 domain-containing protein [Xanthomonas sp. H13-6]
MSATLHPLWRRARRRRFAATLVLVLAALPVAAVAAWRWGGIDACVVAVTLALLAAAGIATAHARRLDRRWLVGALNAHRPLQDSADLLLADSHGLNPLQRRQQAYVGQVLQRQPPDLRPAWRWRRLLATWAVALALAAALLEWPATTSTAPPPSHGSADTARVAPGAPVLGAATLAIDAPAYTGQAPRTQDALDAKAPQGSRLRWQLRFDPQPQAVSLQFHDGRTRALARDGDRWQADTVLERSTLYRIVTEPALADSALHRLDAIPDLPPQVQVLQPEQTLTPGRPGQRQWALQFEASDDYGVAATAQLRVTVAQGSGENIRFREQRFELSGSGPANARRFARTLELAAFGVGPGDDLIAQLTVHDNRAPTPQSARSASLILRMPTEQQQQASDLEGAIKKVMPAYFRSQRQIIIDAEALLKQRRALDADGFVKRSDAIGADQRILRLRYGQFLGEEAEGGAKPPPTADAGGHDDDHDDHDHASTEHGHDHGHDHGGEPGSEATPVFGSASDVLAEYGHTHDHAEAATLLDPQTRATLKAALDQMWLSEGELRQGHPDRALPYAYKALGYIKQVQQAERIYLARLGPELPPIDPARRMAGKREGIASRRLAVPPRSAGDDTALQAWQALGEPAGEPDLAALTRWLGQHESELGDPLALAAAIEELRAAPDCGDCRARLRAALWVALARPAAAVERRSPADADGRRYLDALREPSP